METKYIFKLEDATLHLSHGNSKLGRTVLNFSILPGNSTHRPILKMRDENYVETGEQKWLCNIDGTCTKHCDTCYKTCYAWKSLCFHHNVNAKAWADNTLLLRSGRVFDMIDEELNNNPDYANTNMFRINTSGEIENLEQLEGWNELAKKHPNIQFSLYTKNYEVLKEFVQKHSDSVENFVINVSQWHHEADNFLKENEGKFNVFEYDDSNKKKNNLLEEDIQRLFSIPHCPAVMKNGRHYKIDGKDFTCDMCGRCYKKTGKTTAVYSH